MQPAAALISNPITARPGRSRKRWTKLMTLIYPCGFVK